MRNSRRSREIRRRVSRLLDDFRERSVSGRREYAIRTWIDNFGRRNRGPVSVGEYSRERRVDNHVPVEHEEVVVHDRRGLCDGVSRPLRFFLLDVGHRTIPVRFTDRLTNRVTAIAGDDDELVDDIDCSVEYLFKQRTITHRKKRFWTPICQGPHAGPRPAASTTPYISGGDAGRVLWAVIAVGPIDEGLGHRLCRTDHDCSGGWKDAFGLSLCV